MSYCPFFQTLHDETHSVGKRVYVISAACPATMRQRVPD
ncbi:hypothetical protein B7759_01536 [Burkholderia glumae]|nr:hypothetical protein KS03_2607 [Burkholderia glumae LMG 2196 = ATCC 33617]QKM54592.1 hypothetical protein CG017_02629 [Burkholderia glumae]QTP32957.1 hypothetical protein B7759_01536 [Burkholderia glumae]